MEVIVQSSLSNLHEGHLTIPTDPSQTVDSLITAYCTEKGIIHRHFYILRNRNGDALHNTRAIGTCGVVNGDVLYLTSKNADSLFMGTTQWWILAGVCLAIGAIGIVAISIVKTVDNRELEERRKEKYAVVVDAGSTHSGIFLYQWNPNGRGGTADLKQVATCKAQGGGIASYALNPGGAGPSIAPCLDNISQRVPTNSKADTPIYVAATAGMRLLQEANPSASQAILESVRSTLKKYSFKISNPEDQVKILNGKEEGTYGWITVNYLKNSFNINAPSTNANALLLDDKKGTFGTLDMGGASTQLTFVPKVLQLVPLEYRESVTIYGQKYELYTNSFLCYGRVEIERRMKASLANQHSGAAVVTNPCSPKGFSSLDNTSDIFEAPCTKGPIALKAWGREILKDNSIEQETIRFNGSSEPQKCDEEVGKLFNFTSCQFSKCSFNGKYIPELHGDYVAFSFFWATIDYLNLTSIADYPRNITLEEFQKAKDGYCSKTYDQVKDLPAFQPHDRTAMCFDAQYLYTLLTRGYQFDASNFGTVAFQKTVSNKDIGWPLGFMLNVTGSLPATEATLENMSDAVFSLLMVVFAVFVSLAAGFACKAKRDRKYTVARYSRLGNYGSL